MPNWLCFLSLLTILTAVGAAAGQEPSDQQSASEESTPSPLRDDPLGHIRPGIGADIEEAMAESDALEEHHGLLGGRLHGRGPVAFEYLYTGEMLTNAYGGITTRSATQYEGLLDLAMRVDFDKTRLPVPGKFFVLFQETHGRGLSNDFVGDAQIVSTIDSFGNIAQVSAYWWETTIGGDFLTVRIGKQDVNGEFHLTESAVNFVHSAYGIPPTLPAPTYPHNSVAAVLLAKLSESLAVKAGIWDGDPNGATWGLSGTGITYTIVEVERNHKLFGKLPGVFDVGFSHLSAIDVVPGEFTPEQYTIYCDFEQALYREDLFDEKNEQGLACFARYGTVFPKAGVDFKDYVCFGLVYKGLFQGRDEDLIGAGVNHLRHNLGGTGTETATELFYKAHVRPWATVQPTLQFISSPSGVHRDSLVAGVRFQIVL
jgi:porin